MNTHFDIVCISTQEWGDLWTRKQRFMRHLAGQGHRVLYVERQLHLLGYIHNFKTQWRRLFQWLFEPAEVEPNLFVCSPPLLLPFFLMFPIINRLNAIILRPFIRRKMHSLGIKHPVLWIYPLNGVALVNSLDERLVIYDCVDEWSAFKGLLRPEVIQAYETQLIQVADVTIVTMPELYKTRQQIANRIYLVPNAAEIDHFLKAQLPETEIPEDVGSIPQPIIGFVGSVQYWLDFKLLEYLARTRPAWSFVLIGPVGHLAPVDTIASLPNVHLLGPRLYQTLPNYIKAFQVCINPFKVGDLADGCDPLKLYEYLGAGKPVVSVDMPAAHGFREAIQIARSPEEFLSEIEAAIDEGDRRQPDRLALAEQHGWQARFRQIDLILTEVLREDRN
jgi:glycosyltransferase involved in cell wall biosynthesis